MNTRHITIIGAGIGGLTTALLLKRKGFKVTVYERAKEFLPLGAGLMLGINAMQVIKQLGLHEKLEALGQKLTKLNLTDEQLQPLSFVDLSGFEHKYQVGSLAIHRADLQNLLINELGPEHILLSKSLAKIEKKEQLTLTFEDNTTVVADVLIGADGIKSKVRAEIFEPTVIRHAQQLCWRGVSNFSLPAKYAHELNVIWGRGKRFGFVNINDKQVYWFALLNSNAKVNLQFNLIEEFKGVHSDVLALIDSINPMEAIQNDITDLKPFKKWYVDNVCLIGDAAHASTPNMGQGACQAIEDAYVLSNCLAIYSVNDAFAQYQKLRIKKALMIVNRSWVMGKLAQIDNGFFIWFRNTMMKMTPEVFSRNAMREIFDLEYKI